MQTTPVPSAGVLSVWERLGLQLRRIRMVISLNLLQHPLKSGQVFYSPGGAFKYRVIGACCRLYDREALPYPSCSLGYRGKQPSWRRLGRRFIPDVAAKRSPSYIVELMNYPGTAPVVVTLYWLKLSPSLQDWWYSKRLPVAAHDAVVNG